MPMCFRFCFSKFRSTQIAMLTPILEKYWPSLYCGDSSTCFGGRGPFWVHEVLSDYCSLRNLRSDQGKLLCSRVSFCLCLFCVHVLIA